MHIMYALIQLNGDRIHDFHNYNKTIALQENYGEIVIENSQCICKLYVDGIQIIINVK